MTPSSTVLAAGMMMSPYHRAISTIAFWCVIAVIAPLAFLFAFMILMWARACWLKSALLIADAISCSILLGAGTLQSLHENRSLCTMLDQVVGAGPVGAFWRCFQGWPVSQLLARMGVGLGLGLGLCHGSGCSVSCSLGLGFGCCCSWRFSGSPSCVARASCEAWRPPPSCHAVSPVASFLAPCTGAASGTLAMASTTAVMSAMPVPHSTLSLWHSSHFVSLSSSNSVMPSHCACSPAACAFSILAILSIVWCSWVTTRACRLTDNSIQLLQSRGVLTGSEVLFLTLVAFLLCFHCSLAATMDMRVVFPDLWPAAPLAYPPSTMFMSLSTWGFSIVPPMGLWPSWIAIMASLLDDMSSRCIACIQLPSLVQGGWKCPSRVSSMGEI